MQSQRLQVFVIQDQNKIARFRYKSYEQNWTHPFRTWNDLTRLWNKGLLVCTIRNKNELTQHYARLRAGLRSPDMWSKRIHTTSKQTFIEMHSQRWQVCAIQDQNQLTWFRYKGYEQNRVRPFHNWNDLTSLWNKSLLATVSLHDS